MASKKETTYKIEGSVVVCRSSSGKTYSLNKDHCECVGFTYHRFCKHLKEAKALGLFDKIEKAKAKAKPGLVLRSAFIIEQRKKAIKAFLIKHGIKAIQSKIDRLEPLVTINMTPKEFLRLAK